MSLVAAAVDPDAAVQGERVGARRVHVPPGDGGVAAHGREEPRAVREDEIRGEGAEDDRVLLVGGRLHRRRAPLAEGQPVAGAVGNGDGHVARAAGGAGAGAGLTRVDEREGRVAGVGDGLRHVPADLPQVERLHRPAAVLQVEVAVDGVERAPVRRDDQPDRVIKIARRRRATATGGITAGRGETSDCNCAAGHRDATRRKKPGHAGGGD